MEAIRKVLNGYVGFRVPPTTATGEDTSAGPTNGIMAGDGNGKPYESHNDGICGEESVEGSSPSSLIDGDRKKDPSCLTISVYSAAAIALVCIFLIFGRSYIKYMLMSLEKTNFWISLAVFVVLFTIVSFPMTWGYILLNIAAGYLYGLVVGILAIIGCALTGVFIAHIVIRKCLRNFVMSRLANDSIRSIMNVVESDMGFRVVIWSRLTPIPFGLQNGLFAVSIMISILP